MDKPINWDKLQDASPPDEDKLKQETKQCKCGTPKDPHYWLCPKCKRPYTPDLWV